MPLVTGVDEWSSSKEELNLLQRYFEIAYWTTELDVTMMQSKKSVTKSWSPYFQFQSHESEFDYLKSLEIEEKINQIKFCRPVAGNLFLLTTNGSYS